MEFVVLEMCQRQTRHVGTNTSREAQLGTGQGISWGIAPAGTMGNKEQKGSGADPTQALPWIILIKGEVGGQL